MAIWFIFSMSKILTSPEENGLSGLIFDSRMEVLLRVGAASLSVNADPYDPVDLYEEVTGGDVDSNPKSLTPLVILIGMLDDILLLMPKEALNVT